MVALTRLSLLRPPFTHDDLDVLGAAHATFQRIGFEAVLVTDPTLGEVIYVGPCIGETHWRAARTLGGDAVEITRIGDDHARFVGDRVAPTLRDALAVIIGEMQMILAEVTRMATSVIARAA